MNYGLNEKSFQVYIYARREFDGFETERDGSRDENEMYSNRSDWKIVSADLRMVYSVAT